MQQTKIDRRTLLGLGFAATAAWTAERVTPPSPAPLAPVSIVRCRDYGSELKPALALLFDGLGGLKRLVAGKTVAIKVNLTGGAREGFGGRSAGQTFQVHPSLVLACCHALAAAGARRVRLLEGWAGDLSADDFFRRCGWDLTALRALPAKVEFENTNNRGSFRSYSHLKVRHRPYIFPSFELNRSYEECDLLVSLAKMKNHFHAGLTLTLKNFFGATPIPFYGDDAGSEQSRGGRGSVLHKGTGKPAPPAEPEVDPNSPRDDGYRVTRIPVDLVGALPPISLSVIDGIQTVQGGEGPWIKPLRVLDPHLLMAGLNPVCTDAVCAAAMGYDPLGESGSPPFYRGDNSISLAAQVGMGSADVSNIDVRGLSLREARFNFEPNSHAWLSTDPFCTIQPANGGGR